MSYEEFSHSFGSDIETHYTFISREPRPGLLARLARVFRLPYGWVDRIESGIGELQSIRLSPETGKYTADILLRKSGE